MPGSLSRGAALALIATLVMACEAPGLTPPPTSAPTAARTPTPTVKPAATVTPQVTPKPTVKAPPAPGVFTDGTWRVGTATIPAGTYRTAGGDSCYWARLSGFGGTIDEIIASEFSAGPQVVAIAATDAGFKSSRCGIWRLNASAVPTAAPGDGTWRVGLDLVPGIYQATVTSDLCYWARLTGFGGTIDDIAASDIVTGGSAIVTIAATDIGFKSSRCGDWTLAP